MGHVLCPKLLVLLLMGDKRCLYQARQTIIGLVYVKPNLKLYAIMENMAGAYNEDCVSTDINNPVKELSMSLKKEEDYIRFFFLPPVVDKSLHVFFTNVCVHTCNLCMPEIVRASQHALSERVLFCCCPKTFSLDMIHAHWGNCI